MPAPRVAKGATNDPQAKHVAFCTAPCRVGRAMVLPSHAALWHDSLLVTGAHRLEACRRAHLGRSFSARICVHMHAEGTVPAAGRYKALFHRVARGCAFACRAGGAYTCGQARTKQLPPGAGRTLHIRPAATWRIRMASWGNMEQWSSRVGAAAPGPLAAATPPHVASSELSKRRAYARIRAAYLSAHERGKGLLHASVLRWISTRARVGLANGFPRKYRSCRQSAAMGEPGVSRSLMVRNLSQYARCVPLRAPACARARSRAAWTAPATEPQPGAEQPC